MDKPSKARGYGMVTSPTAVGASCIIRARDCEPRTEAPATVPGMDIDFGSFARRGVTLVALMLASALPAQQGERDFLEAAADKLDGYAKACLKGGYPRRAKQVWLEVIHDYLTDHAASRKALGFLPVGSSWAPDPKFEYPTVDTPNASTARSLEKRWDKLAKELGAGHRDLAQRLDGAGDSAGAQTHYDRALRFLPSDPAASKARKLKNFEGVLGTEVELEILRRSRQMARLIETETKKPYAVKKVSKTHPWLDAAGVPYSAYESKNFAVWGDFEESVMTTATQFAERALAFSKMMFKGHKRFRWPFKDRANLAFFKGKVTWEKIVRANVDQFSDGTDIEFLTQNARITRVGSGQSALLLGGHQAQAEVEDLAVRYVVEQYSALQTDGLKEGIGHAVVGMFFGRNLTFSIAQEKETHRTSSGAEKKREERLKLPDLSVWADLAAESAWERSDIPAAQLPLISAASFSSEARIKAWSFCDYLLRRDPPMLLALDRTKRAGANNQGAVMREFKDAAEMELKLLEQAWRDFWTRDTPVMRAIRSDKTPLESVSKIAPTVLDAFNAVRAKFEKPYRLKPVGWVAEYSEQCKDHATYLKSNGSERGPDKEHTQSAKKRGFTSAGRKFSRQALVTTKANKIDEVAEQWIDWPGYRDALLNSALENVGVYGVGKIAVLDVTRGMVTRPGQLHFPVGNMQGVGTEVVIKDLGKEFAALLKKNGKKKGKVVGYPLSYHFYNPSAMPKPDSIRCTVMRGKEEVEGFLHIADDAGNRRVSAPGLVVFYPFEPLKRGNEYRVKWEFETDEGKPHASEFSFKTR